MQRLIALIVVAITEVGKMKHSYPKVNTYNTELKLEQFIEIAMNSKHIKKPISWALYQTWKWADKTEEIKEDERINTRSHSN